MCGGMFTCADNSKAVSVCCLVLAEAAAVLLWPLLLWMGSLDSAAPSTPTPRRYKHTNMFSL